MDGWWLRCSNGLVSSNLLRLVIFEGSHNHDAAHAGHTAVFFGCNLLHQCTLFGKQAQGNRLAGVGSVWGAFFGHDGNPSLDGPITHVLLSNGKLHSLHKYSTEIRALEDMDTEFRISCGNRLREERERIGKGQAEMAASTGVKPRTYQDWERGVATVSTEFLAMAATLGIDVHYVITGARSFFSTGEIDALTSAVLNSFRRCSPEKQIEAVQYMALLAAGVAPAPSSQTDRTVTKTKVSKSILGVAIGNVVGKKASD